MNKDFPCICGHLEFAHGFGRGPGIGCWACTNVVKLTIEVMMSNNICRVYIPDNLRFLEELSAR